MAVSRNGTGVDKSGGPSPTPLVPRSCEPRFVIFYDGYVFGSGGGQRWEVLDRAYSHRRVARLRSHGQALAYVARLEEKHGRR